jgi:hypothetical protein
MSSLALRMAPPLVLAAACQLPPSNMTHVSGDESAPAGFVTNDALRTVGIGTARDCSGVVSANGGLCESRACDAFVSGNAGLCP